MDLIKILENKAKYKISLENNQIGTLSGSNALLFDGNVFEAESNDHCPRIALLRRVGGLQEKKEIKSFISNHHGRTFETFLSELLKIETNDNNIIEFMEEEEVEVKLEDDIGNLLLTARPDKIIKYKDILYPVEIKTIQSNTSAYSVFIKNKPKLGALIQIAIYLIGHQLNKGFILYCASNWFNGYYGKTRWKVDPSFKTFEIELIDGDIYCNEVKTIVNYNKIIQGCYKFIEHKNNNTIPERPLWKDLGGEHASYSGCTYCFASAACDEADIVGFNLIDFFNKLRS
jgi:hypothetical protein